MRSYFIEEPHGGPDPCAPRGRAGSRYLRACAVRWPVDSALTNCGTGNATRICLQTAVRPVIFDAPPAGKKFRDAYASIRHCEGTDIFHHLRSLVQVRSGRPSAHGKKLRKSSFRPCLESLEGRIVPTVFHPSPSAAHAAGGAKQTPAAVHSCLGVKKYLPQILKPQALRIRHRFFCTQLMGLAAICGVTNRGAVRAPILACGERRRTPYSCCACAAGWRDRRR